MLASRRPDQACALLLLDLDRFKEVNDAFGHATGDDLLKQVGPGLGETMRSEDILARLGGDEFALFLRCDIGERAAVAVAERIRAAFTSLSQLDGMPLHVDVSVGIALPPAHAATRTDLLRCADMAMYQAKWHRVGHAVTGRTEVDRIGSAEASTRRWARSVTEESAAVGRRCAPRFRRRRC